MDGLSALSVAASVAQFLEFGCSLVSKGKEIYRSAEGASSQQIEVEAATKLLVELSTKIREGAEDQALQAICDGCISVSQSLLAKLENLKVQDGQRLRKYKSFGQALKSIWSKGSLDDIAKQLKEYQEEMDAHVLVSLSAKFNNLSLLQDERFTSLDRTLQQVIEPLLQHLVQIHAKLEVMTVQNDASLTAGPRQGDVRTSDADPGVQCRDLEQKINNALLHGRHFPTMTHRELEIAEAHQRTFSWIFHDQQGDSQTNPLQGHRHWSNFVKWLREDGGVYWINGKAGSGKSTLMRFIVQSQETQLHLRHWAMDSDLQVASFYFWSGGSELQRSHKGLLQSLLFDILKERSELTRSVFDIEWKDFETIYNTFNVLEPRKWEISTKRLKQCFNKLIHLTKSKFRLCFFIDGLDESQEPPEELLELIEMASSSPFIKVCLSSRPLLVFEEAFEAVPSLRLQDLTLPDILLYVHENLRLNRKMKKLKESNPSGVDFLVTKIVTKADGVFLWVRIATKSLLDGLRNRDEISDLQRRLDILPPDLDTLYSHMIDHIDPLYIVQASQIFQIFDVASDLVLNLSILELELAVSADYPTAMSESSKATQTMSDSETFERVDRMAAHLKSRCEGLLEAHDILDRPWKFIAAVEWPSDDENLVRIRANFNKSKRPRASWRVSYLHRTVKDFLKSDRIRTKLQQSASLPNFDPNLSLLMSYVIN